MKVERKVALTLDEEIAQLEYQVQIANAAGNKRALSHAERAYYEFTRALQIIGIDGLTRRIDGDASCSFFDFDPEVAGASDTGDTVAVPKKLYEKMEDLAIAVGVLGSGMKISTEMASLAKRIVKEAK